MSWFVGLILLLFVVNQNYNWCVIGVNSVLYSDNSGIHLTKDQVSMYKCIFLQFYSYVKQNMSFFGSLTVLHEEDVVLVSKYGH